MTPKNKRNKKNSEAHGGVDLAKGRWFYSAKEAFPMIELETGQAESFQMGVSRGGYGGELVGEWSLSLYAYGRKNEVVIGWALEVFTDGLKAFNESGIGELLTGANTARKPTLEEMKEILVGAGWVDVGGVLREASGVDARRPLSARED